MWFRRWHGVSTLEVCGRHAVLSVPSKHRRGHLDVARALPRVFGGVLKVRKFGEIGDLSDAGGKEFFKLSFSGDNIVMGIDQSQKTISLDVDRFAHLVLSVAEVLTQRG